MAKKRGIKDPGLRAWFSLSNSSRAGFRQDLRRKGGTLNRTTRALMGRGIRRSRIGRGLNPNTGKVYSAKDLNLKGTARKSYKSLVPAAKAGLVKSTGVGGTKRVARAIQRRYR